MKFEMRLYTIPSIVNLKCLKIPSLLWHLEITINCYSKVERHLNPGLFNPGLFNHEFLNHGVEKSGDEKSRVEMSFNLIVTWYFIPGLFNAMVQKFTFEKSGVENVMVEKLGVEMSWVEAWGWKVHGLDVLQLFCF